MKHFLFTGICLLITLQLMAQDGTVKDLKKESEKTFKKDPEDTIPGNWKKGGLFNLNINQGSLSNWSAGGDQFSFH